jgi:hypothetical protein
METPMIPDRAIAHVLRPLSDPLPPALQQRGRKIREALEGLDAKDRLELTCRTVLGALMTVLPRFRGEGKLVFNTLCAAVLQWLQREMKPLRFVGPH